MVLSQYLKRLEENFRKKIISLISQNDENYKKILVPNLLIYIQGVIAISGKKFKLIF